MLNFLVRRNYAAALEALEAGDLDALLKNFDPQCQFTFVGTGALGASSLTGDDIRLWFDRYLRLIPERRFRIERFASSGPLWRREVAAHVRLEGRLADGTAYDNQFAHFLLVQGGRITRDLVVEDTQRWQRAAGRLVAAGVQEADAPPVGRSA